MLMLFHVFFFSPFSSWSVIAAHLDRQRLQVQLPLVAVHNLLCKADRQGVGCLSLVLIHQPNQSAEFMQPEFLVFLLVLSYSM